MPNLSQETSKLLPRRNLLRLITIGLASAVATQLPINLENINGREVEADELESGKLEISKTEIGNLHATIVLTEHDTKATLLNFRKIAPLLDEEDQIIIPEYFPPDYRPTFSESPEFIREKLVEAYDETGDNLLFDAIEAHLRHTSDVEVRVLDPAYSGAAIMLRLQSNWPFITNTALIDAILAEDIAHRHSKHNTRRDDLKSLKTAAELLGIITVTPAGIGLTQGSKYGTETTLRRVFIAQALKQFGNQVDPGTKATIIYPAGHWYGDSFNEKLGIKNFLENDNLRQFFFNEYSRFKQARHFEPLFHTRHYKSNSNGKWTKLEGFEIT